MSEIVDYTTPARPAMTKSFSASVYYPPGSLESLRPLVETIRYKPGWEFALRAEGGGLHVLLIRVHGTDNRNHRDPWIADHTLPIPPVPFSTEEWARWILDQILLVERHEACESFELLGVRPFFPPHGPGVNPYEIRRIPEISLDFPAGQS